MLEGKSRYQRVAVVSFTLALALVALNLILFVVNQALDHRRDRINPVSRKHGIDLTRHYPGMRADEVNEMLRATWSLPALYAPFTGRRLSAFRSTWVNIHPAGFRISRNQAGWPPDRGSSQVIFVFGGSTAFGFGVRDEESIPSQLVAKLSQGPVTRPPAVYNLAIPANTSTSERIQFQQLLAESMVPDVAIFLDGLNDRTLSHEPLGTPMVEEILNTGSYLKASHLLYKATLRLPMTRTLSRLLHALGWREGPADPVTTDGGQLAEVVVGRYLRNRQMTAAVARSFGVRALFVWQPVPDYAQDPRLYPFEDLDRPEARARRRVYEEMRRLYDAGALGADFAWCADLAAGANTPQYVDVAHYTAEMCDKVADCIAGALAEAQHLPPSAAGP